MDNIDQQWDEVLLSMSKHFGVTVNFEFLIFAIGIQERGCGFIDFQKKEKMDLINLAKCRMLERAGFLEESEVEDGWPQFNPKLTFLSLNDSEKDAIIKEQMIGYLKANENFIN